MDNQAIEQILAQMDAADERQIDLATYQHRMMRLRVATTAVVLVGDIGVLAYAAMKLWGAWHTGVWPPFWDTMRFVWGAFGLVSIGTVFSERGREAGQAHVLRAQITAQSRRRELPEAEQPQALAPSELSIGAESLGPFQRLERGRTLDMVSVLVLSVPLALAGVLILVLVIALQLGQLPTPADVAITVLVLGLPGACFVWPIVLAIRRLHRIRRPLTVVADGRALGWETATGHPRRTQLAWHEVGSFFVIREPGVSDDAYSVFVAQGNGARLVWVMPRAPSSEQRAANERLVRLIITHTHLPLAVVSAAVLSPEDYDVTAPEPSPIEVPTSRGVARFLSLSWVISFLLTLFLTVSGLLLQRG